MFSAYNCISLKISQKSNLHVRVQFYFLYFLYCFLSIWNVLLCDLSAKGTVFRESAVKKKTASQWTSPVLTTHVGYTMEKLGIYILDLVLIITEEYPVRQVTNLYILNWDSQSPN